VNGAYRYDSSDGIDEVTVDLSMAIFVQPDSSGDMTQIYFNNPEWMITVKEKYSKVSNDFELAKERS
jgi:hypothetical protein